VFEVRNSGDAAVYRQTKTLPNNFTLVLPNGDSAVVNCTSKFQQRFAGPGNVRSCSVPLVNGGFSFDASACSDLGTLPPLISAELYDPSSGSFSPTGSMSEARGAHTATLLSSGKVLVVGGGNTGGGRPPFAGGGSATAEVYDPATETFTPTANMSTARIGQTVSSWVARARPEGN
jgi:hypothetical protein